MLPAHTLSGVSTVRTLEPLNALAVRFGKSTRESQLREIQVLEPSTTQRINLTDEQYVKKLGRPIVVMFGYNEKAERVMWRYSHFRSRFYCLAEDKIPFSPRILEIVDEPRPSLFGDHLKKIYTKLPADVGTLRTLFPSNFEADIPFPDVFKIEKDLYVGVQNVNGKISPVEPLPLLPPVLYLDIEVASPPEVFPNYQRPLWPIVWISTWWKFNNGITCWTFREDYKEHVEFRIPVVDQYTGYKPESIEIRYFSNEYDMIRDFLHYWHEVFQVVEVAGWNIHFDGSYMVGRLDHLGHGLSADSLSPIGTAFARSEDEAVIYGVDLWDVQQTFKDFWTMAFGELDAWSFSKVIENPKVIGKPKTEFWRGGEIREIWKNHPDELERYGVEDAKDFAALMLKYDLLEYYNSLREIAGTKLSQTTSMFKLLDMMALRDKEFVLPSGQWVEKTEGAPGAIVFPAPIGLQRYIIQVDERSLYVNMIKLHNISHETEDPKGEHSIEITLHGNTETIRFRNKPDGLLKRIVLKLEVQRDKVRSQMVGLPEGSDCWKLLYQKQNALKFLTSSLPGLLGNQAFRLMDLRIHAAVMKSGKDATIYSSNTAKERMNLDTIYGDTDSLFLQGDESYEIVAPRVVDIINEALLLRYRDPVFVVKLEELWRTLLFLRVKGKEIRGRKKFYVGYTQSGELRRKGLRESAMSDLTLELLDGIFRDILIHEEEKRAMQRVRVARKKFEELPVDEISIPIGMSKDPYHYGRFDEKKQPILNKGGIQIGVPAQIRGVRYAIENLKLKIGTGTKIRYVYIKEVRNTGGFGETQLPQTDVISYEDSSQVDWDRFIVDRRKMFEKVVLDKIEYVFLSLGRDLTEVLEGNRQTGLGEFFATPQVVA